MGSAGSSLAPRLAAVVLVVAGCSFTPPAGDRSIDMGGGGESSDSGGELPPGKTRRVQVTGDRVIDGPHQNFPLLFSLTDPALRAMASGGDVAATSGADIYFSADPAGLTGLAFDIERYMPTTGELIAWIKIPSLSATSEFYLHYGDPAVAETRENKPATWSADFAAVYHLADTTDATGNNLLTDRQTTARAAEIGGGRSFDGTSSAMIAGGSTTLDQLFALGGTVEGWLFAETSGEGQLGRVFEKGTAVRVGRCDGTSGQMDSLFFTHVFDNGPATWCTPPATAPRNQWLHFAVVYNRDDFANQPALYINGGPVAAIAIELAGGFASSDSGSLVIGDRESGGRAWRGLLDEVRLAHAVRTPGWIATSFNSQSAPTAFVTVDP